MATSYGPFQLGTSWGKPAVFAGHHGVPLLEAEFEVESGGKTSRMTATRVVTGAVVFGPVGAILGGMAKKDTSRGRLTLLHHGHPVESYAFPGKDAKHVYAFVETVGRAQADATSKAAAQKAADEWRAQQQAAAERAAQATQQATAVNQQQQQGQWAPDPSHAHELRWWDGVRWTDHVVDAGVQTIDQLR